MLFNSISFAIFLPIVFILYWFATKGNIRLQNILLLVSSYFFYASWNWHFLFLLIFSTLLDYFSGLKIYNAEDRNRKRFWLWLSISINLGFLAVFKYYNFFISSFADGLSLIGVGSNFNTLQVLLPIGISFYTFHGLSYVIDIYKDRIKPERNFIDYSVFVSFFPLLVAGPIERATHLLPQILKKREFDYNKVVDGLRQILWGLFKKIVIADNCAYYANEMFNHSASHNGSSLVIGAIFFTIQIYGDFSGYSDIALGTARLFGIDLLRNFAYPYFSRDIAEFWRRWHISLSSWFRDYLYYPLGGSRGGTWLKVRNTIIIFLVSGFWHGANWTYLVWGALHAIYMLPLVLSNRNRNHIEIVAAGKLLPTVKDVLKIISTFGLVAFALIFFRADNIKHALSIIGEIFSSSLFMAPHFPGESKVGKLVIVLFAFMIIEWLGREEHYALAKFGLNWHKPLRHAFYYAILIMLFYFGGSEQQFIYFQF